MPSRKLISSLCLSNLSSSFLSSTPTKTISRFLVFSLLHYQVEAMSGEEDYLPDQWEPLPDSADDESLEEGRDLIPTMQTTTGPDGWFLISQDEVADALLEFLRKLDEVPVVAAAVDDKDQKPQPEKSVVETRSVLDKVSGFVNRESVVESIDEAGRMAGFPGSLFIQIPRIISCVLALRKKTKNEVIKTLVQTGEHVLVAGIVYYCISLVGIGSGFSVVGALAFTFKCGFTKSLFFKVARPKKGIDKDTKEQLVALVDEHLKIQKESGFTLTVGKNDNSLGTRRNDESRSEMDSRALKVMGVEELTSIIRQTMGPKGLYVVIEKSKGEPPLITKDGVEIANTITLKDVVKNIGAGMLKHVANATKKEAGDGTTCAVILARAIYTDGCKAVAAGVNDIDLVKGIYMAVAHVVNYLTSHARMIIPSEKKDSTTDVLNAVTEPTEDECLPGGGTALLFAAKDLEKLSPDNFNQRIGVHIVKNALKAPLHTIASNAGAEGDLVVSTLLQHNDPERGYNAFNGQYVNMVEAGIMDRLKVIVTAVKNAVSIACFIYHASDNETKEVGSTTGH